MSLTVELEPAVLFLDSDGLVATCSSSSSEPDLLEEYLVFLESKGDLVDDCRLEKGFFELPVVELVKFGWPAWDSSR